MVKSNEKPCVYNTFLDTHRDVELSAAKFEYSIYLYGEASQKAIIEANA